MTIIVDDVQEPSSVGLAQIQHKISSGPVADNADALFLTVHSSTVMQSLRYCDNL